MALYAKHIVQEQVCMENVFCRPCLLVTLLLHIIFIEIWGPKYNTSSQSIAMQILLTVSDRENNLCSFSVTLVYTKCTVFLRGSIKPF